MLTVWSSALAIPKSPSLNCPLSVTNRFSGLMSRCRMPHPAQALNASRAVLSLSADDRDQDEGTRVCDIPVPSHEEALTERLSLKQALSALDDSERSLIQLRYFSHKTQQETAERLGATQVQISRREKKILLKMRAMLAG